MDINQTEKEKLYRGFELFKNAFSSYIVSLLKRNVGDNWRNEFVKNLTQVQFQAWQKKERKGKKPEQLIDFQHFKHFAIKNKDYLRDDFEEKTARLPTLLEEIVDARNCYAHFDSIEEDDAMKAWINMRTIARLLGMSELEQEIRGLERGDDKEKFSVPETARPAFNPLPLKAETIEIKTEAYLPNQRNASVPSNPFETLDIVSCANSDFRKTVFSHNVYLCPAAKGAYSHKQCKYLGVYWEKHVGAVSEIEAVVDVVSPEKAEIYFVNGDKKTESYLAEAKEKALALRPEHLPIRVFLLGNLYVTNFTKDSPGGMFGNKIYLNVEDLGITDAEDLAGKLCGKNYSEFGL